MSTEKKRGASCCDDDETLVSSPYCFEWIVQWNFTDFAIFRERHTQKPNSKATALAYINSGKKDKATQPMRNIIRNWEKTEKNNTKNDSTNCVNWIISRNETIQSNGILFMWKDGNLLKTDENLIYFCLFCRYAHFWPYHITFNAKTVWKIPETVRYMYQWIQNIIIV